MSTSDPGLPYGSGREEAAADAEPTMAHESVAPPKSPSGDTPPPSTGAPAGEAAPPPVQPSPPSAPSAPSGDAPPLAIPGIPLDRPELHVAAAFAGGFVLAMVLKRFAR